MAKSRSALINLQGTLENLTFVKSQAYGDHVRMKRGTHKKAGVNDAFKKAAGAMQLAIPFAQMIKYAFEPYSDKYMRDGTVWSRLLSIFQKCIAAGKAVDYSLLKGFEFNQKHKLDAIAHPSFSLTVDAEKNVLRLSLEAKVSFPYGLKIDGYSLNIIAASPNSETKTAEVCSVEFVETDLKKLRESYEAEIPLPPKYEAILIAVKVNGYVGGAPSGNKKVNGMRVVEVVMG